MGLSLPRNERVIYDLRPKWSAWFWSMLFLWWTIAWPMWVWLIRKRTRYVVTTGRVVKKKGWLSKSSEEYPMEEIRHIKTSRSIGERILGGGTIILDTGPGEIHLEAVPGPRDVVNTIREQKRTPAR